MALVLSNFLINLLCAAYDCDFHNPYPTSAPLENSNRIVRSGPPKDPVVYTNNGGLEGYFMKVVDGRDIYAFEGIPFAEPPTGQYRFRAAVPKTPWTGIRSAKKPGNDCMQLNPLRYLSVVGSLDCLYLNIFSPQISTPKLPVIIFIHGGNFFFGAGSEYGPSYLLQNQVILVSINYRLGVLGFLSTGDEENLGNWGLRDQSLAIKWVHDNIHAFGGDKNLITVAGQSAGGVSTHILMMSTTSIARGLFSKAIVFSGSAFHHWGLQSPEYAEQMKNKLAKVVGCPTNQGSKTFMDCIRRIKPNSLVAAQRQLFVTTFFPIALFAPVIEPNVTGAFFSDTPENYYKNDLVMKIPFLSTAVANEGAFMFMTLDNIAMTNYYLRNWRVFQPLLFDYGRFVENPEVANDLIADTYFGHQNVRNNGLRMNRKVFEEVGSDRYFIVAYHRALKFHSKVAPTYACNYHFRSDVGTATTIHHDYRKSEATHVDDLASLFNCTLWFKPLRRNTLHFEVSKAVIDLITNFAAIGEPLHTRDNGSLEKIWEPISSSNNLQFLKIGTDGKFEMVKEDFEKTKKLQVWERLKIFK